jgi:putative FmdB family regulatory protein
MPLYEYECEACGRRFEMIRRFSDPPLELCQLCGGAVHKLLSSPAIQFKGSGWYITDYARKGTTGGNGTQATAKDKGEPSTADSASSTTPSTPTVKD